jgi:predicted nucleic acid-binding protein
VKYLLATNVLSDFVRGDQAVMARLRQEAPPQLAVSVVTEMEVEYGLARNPNPRREYGKPCDASEHDLCPAVRTRRCSCGGAIARKLG